MEQQEQNKIIKQIPPYDTETERAVISSMIFDRDAIGIASEMLKGEDFYNPAHMHIFNSAVELFIENIPVDLVTLKNKLNEKGILDQVGGISYITSIASIVSTSAHIKHYAKIVSDKSLLRRLIKASNEISSMSYEAKEDVDVIIDAAEKSIFDIMQNRNSVEFVHIREILLDSFEKIEQIYRLKTKLTGVETGFLDFDSKTAGLQPSDLILVAARPSMGKTAFALNIAQHAAVRNKVPTAIFSLEMSKEQLVNRLLCAESSIDAQKLRTGNLETVDWSKLARAMGPLSTAPIYIDDTPGISVMEVRAKCRRLKLEKNIGLVMIDYLQLMSGKGRMESRQQEISEISRNLKAIAREIEAPVIALSQLSRACETRSDHRPMLSDLRESGAIEQDADVVAFLYRDEYYYPETDKKNIAELIIAKQRNGPTGTVELIWLGSYTKFANMQKSF